MNLNERSPKDEDDLPEGMGSFVLVAVITLLPALLPLSRKIYIKSDPAIKFFFTEIIYTIVG